MLLSVRSVSTSLAFAFLAIVAQASAVPAQNPGASDDLLNQLRGGGHVIFMRHPETEKEGKDVDMENLDNCATQRNLSEQGRTTSKTVGDAMRALKVPVGVVMTSQFCRAKEAAKLMGFAETQASQDLNLCYRDATLIIPVAENDRRISQVRKILAEMPQSGTNTLLVSHRPNMEDAARTQDPGGKGFGDVAEGEMVVFKAQGGEPGYRYIGRIPAKRWTEWANLASK